jgi:hypothetical protein
MKEVTSMKKVLWLLALMGLILAGCSDDGTLRIRNNSLEEIWYEVNNGSTEWLNSGESDSYSWKLSSSIFGEEDKKVTVDYGGGYWFWYDYTLTKTVKPGKTVTVSIIGDAGEIEIWNNSSGFYIYYVWLSPSSDDDWGDDDLQGIIGPGYSVVWKVTVGDWDILLEDDWGDQFDSYNNYIAPETRTTFEYTGFRRASNPVGDKKANAEKYTTRIEDKCEKR